MVRPTDVPLYWQVCLINGTVFTAGTLALVLTPARVSRQPVVSEALVLTIGLAAMLLTNGLLLRRSLRPIDRVVGEMRTISLAEPGRRMQEDLPGPGGALVRGFNAMVDRLEAEQGAGAARALAAQEAERHRIAQELHDEVGQSLTVVLLGLKQVADLAPAELREELAVVRDSARAGLDDVRRVARQLRPGVLEDLGLHSALAALTTDFAARGPSVSRRVAPGLPHLSPDAELVVYRVAQEALTNAVRHASASAVELSLTRVGDRVVLEVRDDGVGYRDTPGAGVRGMQDRAALVGADLAVAGTAGRGTVVRLSVPTAQGLSEAVGGRGR
jgi:two-component system sensor histidine kinase UhpB